jgi:membrane dipeptidase
MHTLIPIFDGHNDVLLRLFNKQMPDVEQLFLDGEDDGQLDFPRAVRGGFAGGMFAIFVSSKDEPDVNELMRGESYDLPLPDVISAREALPSP